jgi:hypothetical protein
MRHIKAKPLGLLLSLVAVYLIYGLLDDSHLGRIVEMFLVFVLLCYATLQLLSRSREHILLILLAVLTFGSVVIEALKPNLYLEILTAGLGGAFFLFATLKLIGFALQAGPVSKDRLYISVSAYLLMGWTWARLYRLIEVIHPNSFGLGTTPGHFDPTRTDLLYFSLATLTTLGYGDIIPVNPEAKMVAVLEAAAGVLYVGILVARLVSSYSQSAQE